MNSFAVVVPVKRSTEDSETHPFLSIGFRPFFLLAGFAAFSLVPTFLIRLGSKDSGLAALVDWHVHEMLFGFTAAVVAGFLLTAAGNWTNERTLTGSRLGALAVLWLLGRFALIFEVPKALGSAVDLSFYPCVALAVGAPIFRARNRRNYVFLVLLLLLFGANLAFHLAAHGIISADGAAKEFALRLYAFMICLVAGRIVPLFTKNATGDGAIHSSPIVDRVALGSLAVAIALDHFSPLRVSGTLWFFAGTMALLRMRSWGTRRAKAPLLWVLHAGYAVTSFSFLLLAGARFGFLGASTATHAFTLGGLGLLCFGMMTRVSLGHSGRMLAAPRRITITFALILMAMAVRTLGPILAPNHHFSALVISASLWCLSSLLFLSFGLPIWFSRRLDRVGNYHNGSPPHVGST